MPDRTYAPTILTTDGRYFDFTNPDPAAITLNAIARGLANTCRFGGQCRSFYSVAEHSIWVSRLVPPHLAVHGLLHDAAEAFIGDMPKPLKEMLPDYKRVEAQVEAVLFAQFGFISLPPEVKQIDRVMLATEQRQIMNNRDRWVVTDEPAEIVLECLLPEQAYRAFMCRALELELLPVEYFSRGGDHA